ncbi:helix-turn-helix transcriptional regulator [Streptomyces clavuligerus]|uniref:AraC family transcriptional regulator n=1 Tax=Streptomyces clavuligerus TaxID=1901 RepID=E2QA23_STRCL|nr:AraC family transcriptional regulator [Streptomyces clavuligerus]ANW17748.1 AraC family transcriptional regulator [Streptomyces clavuligerus]AXU12297.1 AraC family transcriptional regulator [Streptomyces clavuligerus]EFG09722.1 AraC family transcriptional regulator [Streptomyces clavuligerus]MBY6302176.1 AraC family transcriptional regulator [Streptomyces clavuligerus]QCS05078.1 AraC family transcriptional regulator [Streptomyces clavuligerus]
MGQLRRGDHGEWARHWQYEELPGLDLLRAHYVRHTFRRHSHEGFTLAAVSGGIEEMSLPEGVVRAGPGSVIMINPEVPHTARAGVPDGWTYATLYPSVELVSRIAEESGAPPGTPGFGETAVGDPHGAELIRGVHRAAEAGNALAADSLLRVTIARLLARHGGQLPSRAPQDAGARAAARARALLEARMADPPSLERLAQEVGTSPFALLRAFRAAYGMPPHTWLTDARVRRARRLLEGGGTPAETAIAVGFTDQPHLNRHFTRIVGVPPGAYRRERAGRPPARQPDDGPAGPVDGRRADGPPGSATGRTGTGDVPTE